MKTGRPTNASRQRIHGELKHKSQKRALHWLNSQLDALNPGEWFVIPQAIKVHLIESTVRSNLARINRVPSFNIKLHKHKNGEWYIWYCPDPTVRLSKWGNIIDPNKPVNTNTRKIPSSVGRGSIHYSVAEICQRLGMSETTFNALTWDRQLELRIKTGIALRDENRERMKFNQKFANNPTIPTDNTSQT